MITPWLPLLEASRLGLQAQCVIGLRLLRGGGRPAARAVKHMEKAAAMLTAQAAAAAAVATGQTLGVAARKSKRPTRQAVRNKGRQPIRKR